MQQPFSQRVELTATSGVLSLRKGSAELQLPGLLRDDNIPPAQVVSNCVRAYTQNDRDNEALCTAGKLLVEFLAPQDLIYLAYETAECVQNQGG